MQDVWDAVNFVNQSGLLAFVTAVISFVTALLGRSVLVVFAPRGTDAPARVPIRISLKSIIKGWISATIWTIVALVVFLFILHGVALSRLSPAANPPFAPPQAGPPLVGPVPGEPIPGALPDNRHDVGAAKATDEAAYQEAIKSLLMATHTQLAWLIVGGFVFARAACVAARQAKTTGLTRFAHGLASVGSFYMGFEILAHLYIPQPFNDVQLSVVEKWEYLTIVLGCVLGAIMGSED